MDSVSPPSDEMAFSCRGEDVGGSKMLVVVGERVMDGGAVFSDILFVLFETESIKN